MDVKIKGSIEEGFFIYNNESYKKFALTLPNLISELQKIAKDDFSPKDGFP